MKTSSRRLSCAVLFVAIGVSVLFSQGYKDNLALDHPSIQYFTAPLHNRVTRLVDDIESGKVRADNLPHLLSALDIDADSQMLVFSKTSFQAAKISPNNPRAIYFNDDVALGYVRGSSSFEVAALDRSQGVVFYAVNVDASGKPTFTRNEACMRCHQGPNTFGVPGFYIGSVIPGPSGSPLRDDTAIVTDHRTEFKDRWGGWYVNARQGEQPDRANAVAMSPSEPETLVRDSQQNLTNLIGKFNPSEYPNALSDIVALMTFEHQTQMANLITRVGWQSRVGQKPDIDELVDYMLFSKEAPLKEPIEGVSTFASSFAKKGPRDHQGRSLRDFDLQTRMFKYPLSYMIYSEAFDALPSEVRDAIYRRLYDTLSGPNQTVAQHAIIEILRDTKPSLPSYWKQN